MNLFYDLLRIEINEPFVDHLWNVAFAPPSRWFISSWDLLFKENHGTHVFLWHLQDSSLVLSVFPYSKLNPHTLINLSTFVFTLNRHTRIRGVRNLFQKSKRLSVILSVFEISASQSIKYFKSALPEKSH